MSAAAISVFPPLTAEQEATLAKPELQKFLSGSATELLEALFAGTVDAVEVTNGYLARIKRYDRRPGAEINAVMPFTLEQEEAVLKQAALARDARNEAFAAGGMDAVNALRKEKPLLGLPFSVKDNLMVKGFNTSIGVLEDNIATENTLVVERLCNQGAFALCKTNLPDGTTSYETTSTIGGETNNPYDRSRTAGGSSGGEAAAAAMCFSPFGLGNDGGGSIRIPAGNAGVGGLRPTHGLIPTTGSVFSFDPKSKKGIPSGKEGTGARVVTGVIARFAEDIELVTPYLVGADGIDPNVAEDAALLPPKTEGLKVAYFSLTDAETTDPEIQAAPARAAHILESNARSITEIRPEGVAQLWDFAKVLYAPDPAAAKKELTDYSSVIATIPGPVESYFKLHTTHDYSDKVEDAKKRHEAFRAYMKEFMTEYDLLICPVLPFTALPRGTYLSDADLCHNLWLMMISSLTGMPSLVERAGTSKDGLPVGVQVMGRPFADSTVMFAAKKIQDGLKCQSLPELALVAP